MAKKAAPAKKAKSSLGEVVIIHTKSSSHWYALLEPKVIAVEGIKFIEGIQVTGKEGHRMERKRTLIPFEHVASIVEFAAEEDLWSEPQPKHLRLPDEAKQSTLLTSHEQPQPKHNHGNHQPHRDHHHRNKHRGNDNRFKNRNGFPNDRDFGRD